MRNERVYKLVLKGNMLMEVPQSILTKVEGSSLEAMFSGRHNIENKDGHVHLNRDPAVFKLIIIYLLNDLHPPKLDTNEEKKAFDYEMMHWGLMGEDQLEYENLFLTWPEHKYELMTW
jgi:hypothetical protein